MRRSLIPLTAITLGVILIGGAIYGSVASRRSHEQDVRDVAMLRVRLESARLELARAATAADSTRLEESIRQEEEGISQREYHVLMRQAEPHDTWTPTGKGTLTVVLGAALVLTGVVLLRKRRPGAA